MQLSLGNRQEVEGLERIHRGILKGRQVQRRPFLQEVLKQEDLVPQFIHKEVEQVFTIQAKPWGPIMAALKENDGRIAAIN